MGGTDIPVSFEFPVRFDDKERELGRAFVDNGRAQLNDSGARGIYEAEVEHFKRRVFVWIRLSESKPPAHGCDCPHFDETGRGCEHLAALLFLIAKHERDQAIGREAAAPEVLETPPEPKLLLRYLIHRRDGEASGRLVLSVFDDALQKTVFSHETWAEIDDPADIAAVRLLGDACGGWREARRGGGFKDPHGPFRPDPTFWRELIQKAAATGRLFVGDSPAELKDAVATTLGEDLDFVLSPRLSNDPTFVDMRGRYVGKATSLAADARAVTIIGPPTFVIAARKIHAVRTFGAVGWLKLARTLTAPRLPRAGWIDLLAKTAERDPLPRLAPDDRSAPLPIEVARLRPRLDVGKRGERVPTRLSFQYGESRPFSPLAATRLVTDADGTRQYERSEHLETLATAAVIESGGEIDADIRDLYWLSGAGLAEVVEDLLAKGFQVYVDAKRAVGSAGFRIDVKSDVEWFSITASAQSNDAPVALKSLLAALRSGADLVEADDGTVMLLAAEEKQRLERFAAVADMGVLEGGTLRFEANQALVVDAALSSLRPVVDSGFGRLRDRLTSFSGVARAAVPRTLAAELRPYQSEGFAWLEFLASYRLGGILADDMGLGKTVQVIAHLLARNARGARGPHLVVVPRSLVPNWESELRRFAPEAKVRVYSGGDRKSAAFANGEIVITTYGLLRRDVAVLETTAFDLAVFDEAQTLKNPLSQGAQAARRLRTTMRVALTGTPVENDAIELWALVDLTNPGPVGPAKSFRSLAAGDDPAIRERLKRSLKPILLRRRKEDVAKDLPALVQQTILCDLSEEQSALYERIRAAAKADVEVGPLGERRSSILLEALLRLRQAACHPRLVDRDAGGDSGKLDVLFERLEESRAAGRKALVFSQFTTLLDIVRERLELDGRPYAYLDGRTTDREAPVRRFQTDPDCGVFLISLKAGGTGLNLTAAESVFILDPWWNPAVEAQATARAHRIGQEKVVMAWRLVSRGTVEEGMLALQDRKKDIAEELLAGDGKLASITADELAALLG